jgi:hypothetical protein
MKRMVVASTYLKVIWAALSLLIAIHARADAHSLPKFRRISAIGQVKRGPADGMRYRVRLSYQICQQSGSISPEHSIIEKFNRSLLRKERRAFLSQLRTWEFVPKSKERSIATLTNAASCNSLASGSIGIQFAFEEIYPYENPRHFVRTATFLVGNRSEIKLSDIFSKHRSQEALEIISEFARANLRKQLLTDGEERAVGDWIDRGTVPLESSFDKFVIVKEGLRILFEEYQVANYAYGIREVVVPWSILRPIASAEFSPQPL